MNLHAPRDIYMCSDICDQYIGFNLSISPATDFTISTIKRLTTSMEISKMKEKMHIIMEEN